MTEERWAELVRATVGGPVTLGTMFGSKGLRTAKKYFAIWWHGQLVVKIAPTRIKELVHRGVGEPFEPMPGRPMSGWVLAAPAEDWQALAVEARAFVESEQQATRP